MRTIVAAAFVVALCNVSRADDKAGAKEAKMLEGTWQLTEGVLGGKPFPPQVTKGIALTLSPGKYVVMAESKDEGTVKYIPDSSPNAM